MSQLELPNPISQIITICRFEILKFLRGKKILAILGITLTISIFLSIIPELTNTDYPSTDSNFFLSNLIFVKYFLIISATLFGSSSIISEFHERTGYSLFPNPVSKTAIWLGKFLAAEIMTIFVAAIFYGILTISALNIYESLPTQIGTSFVFSLFLSTVFVSISFLISSFARGPTGAAVLVFVILIFLFPMIDQVLISIVEIKPWFTPSFTGQIIEFVLMEPYPIDLDPDLGPRGPFDHYMFVPYVNDSLLIMLTYIIICSITSIILFQRKQMQ